MLSDLERETKRTEELERRLAALEKKYANLERSISVEGVAKLVGAQEKYVARRLASLAALKLDVPRVTSDRLESVRRCMTAPDVAEHVRQKIEDAEIRTDPTHYIVADGLLPQEVFDLLVENIPPLAYFEGERTPTNRNLVFADSNKAEIDFLPLLHRLVWGWVVDDLLRSIMRPALLSRFRGALDAKWLHLFGEEFRGELCNFGYASLNGRIMRRTSGYVLAPHLDVAHFAVTSLLYLKADQAGEAIGTAFYRCREAPPIANANSTYYPTKDGVEFNAVSVVPFQPNRLLLS